MLELTKIFSFLMMMSLGSSALARPVEVYFHMVWRAQTVPQMLDLLSLLKEENFTGITIALTKSSCLIFYAWDCRSSVHTEADLLQILTAAEKIGIKTELEIKLINKQKKSFDHLSHLLLNSETLDPNLIQTQHIYQNLLEYVNKKLKIKHLIVGFDEIHGIRDHEKTEIQSVVGAKILSSEEYLMAIKYINNYATKNSISISIYGDMLFSKRETKCADGPSFHGELLEDYGEKLRKRVPKNIEIINYFYFKSKNFCSLDILNVEFENFAVGIWRPNKVQRRVINFIKKSSIKNFKLYLFNFTDYPHNPRNREDIRSYLNKRIILLKANGII